MARRLCQVAVWVLAMYLGMTIAMIQATSIPRQWKILELVAATRRSRVLHARVTATLILIVQGHSNVSSAMVRPRCRVAIAVVLVIRKITISAMIPGKGRVRYW